MALFEEIPHTKQGIITFRTYAEAQIKSLEKGKKQMEKMLVECDRRLDKMKGEK